MIAGFLTIHSINLYSAEPVQLESRFDLDEVKWIQVQGNSSVNGTAFISLSESERKGCAGFNVELLPVAKYSNERILKIYGNNVSGKVLLKNNPPTFTPDHPQYHEMVRKSKCNNNSHFSFEDIPAGEYYVMVFVISEDEKGQSDGGVLMHRISVAAAEHKVVDISK
jgi:broad specificity polyphosphatase/5'/3'-nucleotidase SurE